jgi:hypothetical protein
MSFNTWRYAFANGMTCEQQKENYFRLVVPESKLIVRDTITSAAKVNFDNPHAPLLFVSGSNDHTIPASLNYANYKKYRNSGSVTEYQEFKGRNHLVLAQDSWRENADYILQWINHRSHKP